MSKKLLIVFILFFSLKGNCTQIDTTIFDSDFEKDIFLKFIESSDINPIDLFIAINLKNGNQKINKQLNDYFIKLESTNISQLKAKKKLKTIYNSVHNDFLKKYNGETFFGDIFSIGEFNCVSASALYSLVLSHFKVEYIIKETSTHVYLIADPENTSFLIETTLPSDGLYYFDDKFKRNYIEYLCDNKIISKKEFNNKSISDLFNEHYIKDETIDLYKLAGLQYYNKGISLYNLEDYNNSLKNFEKAEILHPSDLIRFMKNGAIANILNNENLKNDFSGKLLAKFINNNSQNSITIKYCQDYFDNISNEMIMNHPDIDRYDAYFKEFIEYVKDSIDIDNIYQSYYSFKGYYYYSNFNYYSALQEFEKTYNINSSNIRTKQFISEIALKYLVNENNYESTIDSITMYTEKFDFLKNDNILQKYAGFCYAQIIGSSFQYDDFEKGSDYLNRFEAFLKQTPNLKISNEYIGYAYGQVATYYFRKYNYNLAERSLLKGLEISPNSNELKQRLKTLKDASGELNGYTGVYSDNEKYKNASVRAKENRININKNVSKFLVGKWKMDKYIENGYEVKATGEHSFILNLLKSKNVIFTEGTNHHTGTWSYDNNTCNLKLKESEYGDYMNLLILEINDKKIIGLMYFEDDYTEVIDVIFKLVD
ncbi:MAG: hypothetical protein K8R31_14515 [Bacteroidales bacterium]|nr:hypothetical protein [Bacteroidales bacterium]